MHLRLLVTLCNDVVNGSALRAEFAARIEEAAHISTQHRQILIDVRHSPRSWHLFPCMPLCHSSFNIAGTSWAVRLSPPSRQQDVI
jgi:hypothetical protein